MACRLTYLGYLIMAELEKHGQEFVIDNILVKQLSIFAQILGQDKFCSPVVLRIIIGLQDVLDEPFSRFRCHLLQGNVKILQRSNPNFVQLVFQKFL
jgi:hypothetical protein